MSKHSPGPWTEEECEVFDANGQGVCVPYCISNRDKENSKLIAASPELLQAVKAAKVSLIGDDELHRFKDLLKTLDAAINKAEGKS